MTRGVGILGGPHVCGNQEASDGREAKLVDVAVTDNLGRDELAHLSV